jgi:hypothetical protein
MVATDEGNLSSCRELARTFLKISGMQVKTQKLGDPRFSNLFLTFPVKLSSLEFSQLRKSREELVVLPLEILQSSLKFPRLKKSQIRP